METYSPLLVLAFFYLTTMNAEFSHLLRCTLQSMTTHSVG